MRILITNDDGISAAGISALSHVACRFGEVKIVAPDRQQSACGHAMTLRNPLRVLPFDWKQHDSRFPWCDPDYMPSEAYHVDGLPVDCVNAGLTVAWPDGCDLVLSGFNSGPNLGFDVTYSGTVAGAMEGCINGVLSIALSMAAFIEEAPPHYETGIRWLTENFEALVGAPRAPLTFLNINIPAIDYQEIRGSRVVMMGQRIYQDRMEERTDPAGRPYFWQGGVVLTSGEQPDTDVDAVKNGFVSITPVSLDWTNHHYMAELSSRL